MEQTRNSYQVWWTYGEDITNATVVVPLGCDVIGAFSPAGQGVALTRDLCYFAFSFYCTYTVASITVEVEVASRSAALMRWFSHPHSATAIVDTVYNMAAPLGGNAGRLVIATQFMRLKLVVTGGTVANIAFMARAWKE